MFCLTHLLYKFLNIKLCHLVYGKSKDHSIRKQVLKQPVCLRRSLNGVLVKLFVFSWHFIQFSVKFERIYTFLWTLAKVGG